MSIKFWEMKFDGTKYKDKTGIVWELDGTKNNFYSDIAGMAKAGMGISVLTLYYTHKQLVDMEFEEYVDWSKVPIDTKILVWSSKGGKQKEKRHFAGINEYGLIEAWNDGQTSFTATGTTLWVNAELYKEESEK